MELLEERFLSVLENSIKMNEQLKNLKKQSLSKVESTPEDSRWVITWSLIFFNVLVFLSLRNLISSPQWSRKKLTNHPRKLPA